MQNSTQILPKTADSNFGILRSNDLLLLENVSEYQKTIMIEADELLKKTQQDCIEMREQVKQECDILRQKQIVSLERERQELSERVQLENYTLLAECIQNLGDNYHELLSKIICKLGIDSVTSTQLTALITKELLQYIQTQELVVETNTLSQVELQQLLTLTQKTTYVINNDLTDNECVIRDGYSVIYTELKTCGEKFKTLVDTLNLNRGN